MKGFKRDPITGPRGCWKLAGGKKKMHERDVGKRSGRKRGKWDGGKRRRARRNLWSAETKHTQPRAMAEKTLSLALAGSGVQCSNDDRVCTCSNVRHSKWQWGISHSQFPLRVSLDTYSPTSPGFPYFREKRNAPLFPRVLFRRRLNNARSCLFCERRRLAAALEAVSVFPPPATCEGGKKPVCERKIGGPGLDFLGSVPSQARHFHSFKRDGELHIDRTVHTCSQSISLASDSIPVDDCCLYRGEANKEKARVSRQDTIPSALRCNQVQHKTKSTRSILKAHS